MNNSISAASTACWPVTKRHWLPKTATAAIPVVGIVFGAFLESRIQKETSITAPPALVAESLRQQNHYKIGYIINALICMAAAITCVALGIFLPVGGIGFALFFGGLAALAIHLLHRDISYIKELDQGRNPWLKKSSSLNILKETFA